MAQARAWIGTPWRHQGHAKGLGCDCVGLVRGVGEATGVLAFDPQAAEARHYLAYGRQPRPQTMRVALRYFLTPIARNRARPGDILWFRIGRDPMHLAVLTEPAVMVHADHRARRVVEHRIDATWQGRVVAAFRFPLLMDPNAADIAAGAERSFGTPNERA